MTRAELDRGIEALRIKLDELEPGKRIAYWHLMDLLDQGSPELSRALDAELRRLEKKGELVFVEDESSAESFIQRRGAVKKRSAVAARKKKAPAPKKKKPAAKNKAPVKKAAKKKAAKKKSRK